MTMSNIRVRWAPSNTGPDVHVGNVRTILFNYLFAKKNGGTTVFRVEDSDLARSKPEYADAIAATLDWLGLRADEGYKIGGDFGPYLQTEKLARYKQVAEEWIERGLAYRCYCTPDGLTALRNQLPENRRQTFRYPGICRDRKLENKGQDYVIRMVSPTDGKVEWDDVVFGKMVVPNKENYDWVIMRANGIPLYNFGCAVDDYDQKITHVIRGRDHTVNTPQQCIMHTYLSSHPITYCHLPMMLGGDGSKLSKRHASVSITDYRNAGYTKNAILNYLVRFGWGSGDKELFTMEELIEEFSLENCGKNDGKFDPKKFNAILFEHLKSPQLTPSPAYADHLSPFIAAKELVACPRRLESLIPLVRPRSRTLLEAAHELEPVLRDDVSIDPAAAEKILTPLAKENLTAYLSFLRALQVWDEDTLRTRTGEWLERRGLTIKDIGQPTRLALYGRTQSPELFQVMAALGKEKTLSRIEAAIVS